MINEEDNDAGYHSDQSIDSDDLTQSESDTDDSDIDEPHAASTHKETVNSNSSKHDSVYDELVYNVCDNTEVRVKLHKKTKRNAGFNKYNPSSASVSSTQEAPIRVHLKSEPVSNVIPISTITISPQLKRKSPTPLSVNTEIVQENQTGKRIKSEIHSMTPDIDASLPLSSPYYRTGDIYFDYKNYRVPCPTTRIDTSTQKTVKCEGTVLSVNTEGLVRCDTCSYTSVISLRGAHAHLHNNQDTCEYCHQKTIIFDAEEGLLVCGECGTHNSWNCTSQSQELNLDDEGMVIQEPLGPIDDSKFSVSDYRSPFIATPNQKNKPDMCDVWVWEMYINVTRILNEFLKLLNIQQSHATALSSHETIKRLVHYFKERDERSMKEWDSDRSKDSNMSDMGKQLTSTFRYRDMYVAAVVLHCSRFTDCPYRLCELAGVVDTYGRPSGVKSKKIQADATRIRKFHKKLVVHLKLESSRLQDMKTGTVDRDVFKFKEVYWRMVWSFCVRYVRELVIREANIREQSMAHMPQQYLTEQRCKYMVNTIKHDLKRVEKQVTLGKMNIDHGKLQTREPSAIAATCVFLALYYFNRVQSCEAGKLKFARLSIISISELTKISRGSISLTTYLMKCLPENSDLLTAEYLPKHGPVQYAEKLAKLKHILAKRKAKKQQLRKELSKQMKDLAYGTDEFGSHTKQQHSTTSHNKQETEENNVDWM